MEILWVLVAGIVGMFLLTVLRGAPYVPTRKKDLERVFSKLCPLKAMDFVVDIGSGDGVVLRQVARAGARGLGLELNPILVIAAKLLNWRVREQVEVRLADFWYSSFPPETTVVYTFGESRDITRMYERVVSEAARLGKPLRMISYAFPVPGQKPLRQDKSFYVYKITPLLKDKA